jgi:hypothetical protein
MSNQRDRIVVILIQWRKGKDNTGNIGKRLAKLIGDMQGV